MKMQKYFSVILFAMIALLVSCNSDSDSDTFTKEEKELRALLNNEWSIVESGRFYAEDFFDNQMYPVSENQIEEMFGITTYPFNRVESETEYLLGMNRKGGFYSIYGTSDRRSLYDFGYACLSQKGNKFTGYFNGITTNNQIKDMYIRKVDDDTLKLLVVYPIDFSAYVVADVNLYVLKKRGAWDESFSVKKIFEMFDYPPENIKLWDLENYERDKGQGRCQ